MPANPQIIKDGLVVNDNWTLLEQTETTDIASQSIIPLALWQSDPSLQRDDIGIILNNDVDLTSISEDLHDVPVIAIDFPSFVDGRGFSLARLLRERIGYKGEVRAVGYIIRDQLCSLKRSGFNSFSFDPKNFQGEFDLSAMATSLTDFTDAYQTSADTPTPLFRRRS